MSFDLPVTSLRLLSQSAADPAQPFRLLAESIPQLVWTARPDGRLDYANRRWTEFTGISAVEIQGWSWKQMVHHDDLRRALDLWTTAVDRQSAYENEYRLRRHDGKYLWFLVRAEPIFDLEGRTICWFGTCTNIDDRKQREEQTEERCRRIVEAAHDGIVEVDSDGVIRLVNARMAVMLQQLVGDIRGQSVCECFFPEDRGIVTGLLQECLQGECRTFELRCRCRNEMELWTLISLSPLPSTSGANNGAVFIFTDLTEWRKTQYRLKESEEQFRTSIENLLDCFSILTAVRDEQNRIIDFRFRYVNHAACANNSLSFDEHIGRSLLQLFPAHRESGLFDEYCRVVETGAALQREMVFYADNYGGEASQRWFDIRASKLGDGFVAAFRDVTQRKIDELQLRESEKRFRVMAEASPSIEVVIYADGVSGFANSRWEEYFGISFEAASRQNWIGTIHPDDYPNVLEKWHSSVVSGEPFETEYRLPRKDGEMRWHLSRFLPLRDDKNCITAWCGTITDIHELKQTQASLRDSEIRYRTLFELIGEGCCVIEITHFDKYGKGLDYRFVEVNPAFERHTGLTNATGRSARELIPNLESKWPERYGKVATSGQSERFEEFSNALQRWFEVDAFRMGSPESRLVGLLFTDITERMQAQLTQQAHHEQIRERNSQLATVAHISQRLIAGDQGDHDLLAASFQDVCATVGAEVYLHYRPYDEHAIRLSTWQGLTDDEKSVVETIQYGEQLCGRVAQRHRPIVLEDISNNKIEGSEAVCAAGFEAYVGFPLIAGGKLLGTVAFISRTKPRFVEGELEMIGTVCNQVAASLDRKRLLRDLRVSEERQRVALDAAGLGTWDFDLLSGQATWNQRQFELLNQTADHGGASLERWLAQVHPDDQATVMTQIERAERDHSNIMLEHRVRQSGSNELRWLSLHGRFYYEDSHTPIRLSGVTQDITDRKKSEAEKWASQQRLSLGIQVGGLGLMEIDYAKNQCRLTAEAARMFGIDKDACVVPRESVHATFHPDDRDELLRRITDCLAPNGEGRFGMTHRVVRPIDGTVAWLRVSKQVLFQGDGMQRMPILAILAAVDVTAERAAEEAVRAKEAFVRSVLDALPEHVAVLDSSGVIVAVNQSWSHFGWHNGGNADAASPIGVRYLDVFQSASTVEDRYAQSAYTQLSELLDGKLDAFDLEYPCHSPHDPHWYVMSGRRLLDSRHVVISHLEITTRKVTEERLRSSEERFRHAADAVNGIIYDVDFLTGQVERTRGLFEVLGYHPNEVPSTANWWAEQIHPEDRARVTDVDADAFPTDTATTLYKVRHAVGRWIHVEDRAKLVRDESGKPVRLVGCTTDVTERVAAAESLKNREQFVQSVLHASPGVVYLFDLQDGRTVFINQQVQPALGLTPAEVMAGGEGFMAAHVHPDDLPTLLAHVERVASLADNEVLSTEYRMRHVDGRWVWFASRDVVFSRSAEGVAKQILGVATDITERKEAEDRLRASEAFNRSLMDGSADCVKVLDKEGLLLHINGPGMCLMEIEDSSPFCGQDWSAMWPEQCRSEIRSGVEKARGGECYSFEAYCPTAKGTPKWWDVVVSPVINGSDGQVLRLLSVSRDITDRKKAENRLRDAESQLRLAMTVAGVGVIQIDYETNTVVLDTTAGNHFGLDANLPISRLAVHARFHPDDKEEIMQRMARSLDPTGIGTFSMDHRVVRPDGSTKWLSVTKQVRFSEKEGVRQPASALLAAVDITARKEAETAREHALATLNGLIASAPVGILLFDADMRYQHINGPLADMNGLPIEAHLGKTVLEIVPDLYEQAVPLFNRVLEEGVSISDVIVEGETPKAPGSIRTWRESWFPVMGSYNRPNGVGVIVQEITEQRRADQKLRESEERLRMALSASRMVAWEWNSIDEQLRTSENASEVYGLGEGVGLTSIRQGLSLVHPDDVEEYKATFQHAINERGCYVAHYRIVRPCDGQLVWIEERGQTVGDLPEGGVRLYGISMDVTVQYQAKAALRTGEERLHLALSAAQAGVWTTDLMTGRVVWSPENYAIYGYNTEDGYPELSDWDERVHLDDRDHVKAAVADALFNRDPEFQYEFRIAHPTRGERWLLTLGRVDIAATGEPVRITAINLDITDRKRVEQALAEQDVRKDEFLATLAHELRNPLAPIRNGLQILRLAGEDQEAVESTLAMMDRQLGQLVHLVDDLLDVSRISQGKIELRKQRLDIGTVINGAIETSRPLIESCGHHLTVVLPPMPVMLDADFTRLAQVFSNLFNNAAKYSDTGSQIRVSAELQEHIVAVRVRDTGVGISPEMLPKVFGMFTQVDRSLEKAQGGLGIGLNLVKRLVEMHGGSVEAHSQGEGHGSEFVVYLPCSPSTISDAMTVAPGSSSASDVTPQSVTDTPSSSVAANPLRILVADDNQDAATTLAIMLKVKGFEVQTAFDGLQALESAEKFLPDLMLLDIGMPKLNGYEACRRIRGTQWGKNVVLVALTGWSQEEDKRKSQEAGFDYHMVKPIDLGALQNLLRNLQLRR